MVDSRLAQVEEGRVEDNLSHVVLELVVSHYFCLRQSGHGWQDQSREPTDSLVAFLKNNRPNMLNHFPWVVNLTNYKDICDQFFIEMGITERLDD